MEKNVLIIDALPKLKRKLNVCAYTRVSSEKDAMLHSLSAQVSYYNKLIQQKEEWNFCGVYSDEAISGTKTTREGFNEMIDRCKAGEIDLIITKSISRFARNTVTLLEAVRELKEINVDVYFEEQNIHTMSSDGELLLTFLASFAQEESRSVSENMNWRIKKNFEEGKPWGRAPYGYTVIDEKFVIVPEEAEGVRFVFDMFLNGMGCYKIAKEMDKTKHKTRYGGRWAEQTIREILKTYAYTGNALFQRTYTENYITKKKLINRGERPKYHVEESHEPIVSLEEFNKVQEIMQDRRARIRADMTPKDYAFKSKMFCGVCGCKYQLKKNYKKFIWVCVTYSHHGPEQCSNKQIPDAELQRLAKEILDVEELTNEVINKGIEKVVVGEDRLLTFYLTDGRVIPTHWVKRSRSESWTPEMKEQAKLRRIEQNGKSYSNTTNA